MKINVNLLRAQAFVLIIFSVNVTANESFVCSDGNQNRLISIIYQDQQTNLPCEVKYKVGDKEKTLWKTKHRVGYCEAKAGELVQEQINSGWRCKMSISRRHSNTLSSINH